MKGHSRRQSQFELFPGSAQESAPRSPSGFFLSDLTLTLENIVVLGVIIIMSMVLSFSLGVEKGKRLVVAKDQPPQVAKEVPATVNPVKPAPASVREPLKAPADPAAAPAAESTVPLMQAKLPLMEALESPAAFKKDIDKSYTIQVASFRQERHAQKEAMNLEKKGYEIFVMPKGNYSIVCVGKFTERREAKLFSRKLRKRYKDLLVRSM